MTARHQRAKVQHLITFFKKVLVFLFSHVGLCALVIAYTMLGAVVFRAVESEQERQTNHMIRNLRKLLVDTMWNTTYKYDVILYRDIWYKNNTDAVAKFKATLVNAVQRRGYNAKHYKDNSQWTFSGAFFYSLTVITTIGYGNIACRTYFGKALTILYAIIGIPIMLLFLTNIGDVLAKSFRVAYRKSVKFKMMSVLWHKRRKIERMKKDLKERKQKMTAAAASSLRGSSSGGGSAGSMSRKQLKHASHVTLHDDNHNARSFPSTNAAAQQNAQLLPTVSRGESFAQVPTLGAAPSLGGFQMEQMRLEALCRQYELDEMEFRENMEEKLEKINVPVWLVLLTMIGYLIAGSVLFTIWENWHFEDSFYFCYVSLATIGFGDLFPDESLVDDSSSSAQENLVITSFYLLFGMALIAMCFNLAQEEVVTKVTQLAIKVGIVRLEGYDDNDDANA